MLKKIVLLFCVIVVFLGCDKDQKTPSEIINTTVKVEVNRFDYAFASSQPDQLPDLKAKYPLLFSERYPDAFYEEKMKDTLQNELEGAVLDVFAPDSRWLEDEITILFKHIKFYYPGVAVPKVFTVTSDVDYRNKILWNKEVLLIALDTYLGADHPLYENVLRYQADLMRKELITVDIAHAMVRKIVSGNAASTFLDHMIYEGKKLYLMERLLTNKTAAQVLSYSEEQYKFCMANETNIWEYFVSQELLYETDRKLLQRFIDPAPFSKFYLDIDNETPGRVGRFIGYQIVSSFMENNNVNIQAMQELDAQTLFNKAKYKP